MTQQEVEKQPIATSNDVHRRNCTGVGGGVVGGGVIGGVVGGGVVSGGGVTVGGGSVGVGVGVGVGVMVTVGVGVGVGVGPGGTCSSTHSGNTYSATSNTIGSQSSFSSFHEYITPSVGYGTGASQRAVSSSSTHESYGLGGIKASSSSE